MRKEKEGRSSGVPPTVTQNRRRLGEKSNQTVSSVDKSSNPNVFQQSNNAVDMAPSPMIISGNKRSSNNVFEESTFRVPPVPEPNYRNPPPYEHLFEMCKSKQSSKKVPMARSPHLGKVRTPDKAKLARLKTAAPLLPTRSTKPLTLPEEFNFAVRPPKKQVQATGRRVSFELPRKKPPPLLLSRPPTKVHCILVLLPETHCIEEINGPRIAHVDDPNQTKATNTDLKAASIEQQQSEQQDDMPDISPPKV